MLIKFSKLNNKTIEPKVNSETGLITFFSCMPCIVQPSEIKKVRTGLYIVVDLNNLLHIVSLPDNIEKGLSIFSGELLIGTPFGKELIIPLINSVRSPITIAPGQAIAQAYISMINQVVVEEVNLNVPVKAESDRSRPQRRNSGIQFEIK